MRQKKVSYFDVIHVSVYHLHYRGDSKWYVPKGVMEEGKKYAEAIRVCCGPFNTADVHGWEESHTSLHTT